MQNALEPSVEVIYADVQTQWRCQIALQPGESLISVVQRCGVLTAFPQLAQQSLRLGVFGKLREADSPAQPGDRIEIYRALLADPKQARRQRAARRLRGGAGRD